MDLKDIYTNVINGLYKDVERGVALLLEEGGSAETILNNSLIPAMDEVGKRFECQEFYVPEMLVSAHAMKAGMAVLKPLLVESGVEPIGRVVIGTVEGDLHDIGKNLVSMMLEGAGFELNDLGVDVTPERFVEAVYNGADIVGLSALLTTTMPAMKGVSEALEGCNLRSKVKIIIGGAPVTQDYADNIGADGYAADASAAVNVARRFLK
jgi:5-methyltetrahydrofolate--homocysteine methyltransferase